MQHDDEQAVSTSENTIHFDCLVNRQIVFNSLEAKARVLNYRFEVPRGFQSGYEKVLDSEGKFQYYKHTALVEIADVDGVLKKTIKTQFFLEDKTTRVPSQKTVHGVEDKDRFLSRGYHGKKSRNWHPTRLTLAEIINTLNTGHAVAPGLFQSPHGESNRSGDYCFEHDIIMFDADEWTPEHPAPPDIQTLIEQYPDLQNDFYWVGESISSRSSLKPELRCRLLMVLPEPIRKGETDLWTYAINSVVEKYPFIARNVGIDWVRLSYGNARPECENRVLGGVITPDTFANWRQLAAEEQERKEKAQQKADAEKLQREKERAERRKEENKVRAELTKRGHTLATEPLDPLQVFCDADPATLLTDCNIATHLSGTAWHFHGSGQGRSFELDTTGDGSVIKPYSNSAQTASPQSDPTTPVGAHRYIAHCRYGLDMKRDADKYDLRVQLSADGFGDHPDLWREWRDLMNALARKEGLQTARSYRPKVRLKQDPEVDDTEYATMDVVRDLQEQEVLDWEKETRRTRKQHILLFEGAAGTGKSTLCIVELDRFLDISPTREVAEGKLKEANKKKRLAVLPKSRMYNTDAVEGCPPDRVPLGLDKERGESPCAYPILCNTLAERGYVPRRVWCAPLCSRYADCESYGYLSQFKDIKNYDIVLLSYPDFYASDPIYAETIKRLMPKDGLLVVDEVDPAKLPPKRMVNLAQLVQLIEDYRAFDAGVFLSDLREVIVSMRDGEVKRPVKTEKEFRDQVETLLTRYTTDELHKIDYELGGIPVSVAFEKVQCEVYDLKNRALYQTIAHITYRDQTITCCVVKHDDIAIFTTLSDMRYIPTSIYPDEGWQQGKVYSKLLKPDTLCRLLRIKDNPVGINLLPHSQKHFVSDLQQFLSENADTDTPACHPVHEKENPDDVGKKRRKLIGWAFYLAPVLNTRRGIFINASHVSEQIETLYEGTGIDIRKVEGDIPAWLDGCEVFQIGTGRYPPRWALIEKGELKQKGRVFLKAIASIAKTEQDKKILVVGPKDFTIEENLGIPELRELQVLENVSVTNHWCAVGTNEYEDHDISFIFHYEPPPETIKQNALKIYGRTENLSFEREEMTIKNGGMIFEGVNRYVDPRVQQIYDFDCWQQMMQSIYRLRPNLHKNKKMFLLSAEPLELPVMPHIFDPSDLTYFRERGSVDGFKKHLESKESDTLNAKELAKQDGVSERHARHKTQEARSNSKDDAKQLAIQLKKDGLKVVDILSELKAHGYKVSRPTFFRWAK